MFVLIAHTFDGDEIAVNDIAYPSRSSARRARRHVTMRKAWAEIICTRVA
jgi:hypothetical protein